MQHEDEPIYRALVEEERSRQGRLRAERFPVVQIPRRVIPWDLVLSVAAILYRIRRASRL